MKSSLCIISFMDLAFDMVSKMSLSNLRSNRFSPMLHSRSPIVLHFTLSLMVTTDLLLVEGIKSGSRLLFWRGMWMSGFSTWFVEKNRLFLHFIVHASLSKILDYICVSLFLGSLFWSLLLPKPHCLAYCNFIRKKSWSQCQASDLVLLLQCSVSHSESFASLYTFYNQFVNIHKVTRWDFDWGCTESIDQAGNKWCLDNLSLPIHKHGIPLHLFNSFLRVL